jgi:hypothetical protein
MQAVLHEGYGQVGNINADPAAVQAFRHSNCRPTATEGFPIALEK